MSLVAEVLPQVVAALQAFDPYERGVALNQLAQVRAPPVGRAVAHVYALCLRSAPHPLAEILAALALARPARFR